MIMEKKNVVIIAVIGILVVLGVIAAGIYYYQATQEDNHVVQEDNHQYCSMVMGKESCVDDTIMKKGIDNIAEEIKW